MRQRTEKEKANNRALAKKFAEENPERVAETKRRYAQRHPERVAESKKKWREANPVEHITAQRASHMRRTYGLTLERYNELLDLQGYGCAICSGTATSGRFFCVDHDHATGKVRGLLCSRCNVAISHFEHDLRWLGRALLYLGIGK